jgi:hypothetical protein
MEKTVETKDQVEEVKLTPQEQLEELIKTRTGEF